MKLLNRTLFGLLIYSIAVLLIATPVLYVVINNIIINRVDETLQIHKKEIEERLELLPTEADVRQWEDLDGEIVVTPHEGPAVEESIVTIDDYRVLSGTVEIKGKLYNISAKISLVESDDLIKALVGTQVLLLITLITGMLVINWWNSRTAWKPFYDSLNKLKSFRIEENHGITLSPSTISEFNDLNAAIEQLTQRSRQVFVSQREFTENAAHEMQTPLAIFQAKLDILLQTGPTLEQAPLLDSLFDATQRLSKLNKGLLLLAKIENGQFYDVEEVDLYATTKRLTEIKVSGGRHSVKMNPVLLDILLSNLISNANRYASDPSLIQIFIDEAAWTIKNPGSPLTIPTQKIFDRFQKGNTNKDSLGLGLAIAKRICDTSGVLISYEFDNSIHSFNLRFPKS